jgi:serine/threonine protein kinase
MYDLFLIICVQDIKPQNILVSEHEDAVIADFDVSKRFAPESGRFVSACTLVFMLHAVSVLQVEHYFDVVGCWHVKLYGSRNTIRRNNFDSS